ncbi:SagB family peptide dehydrogenase [Nonomuraea sp. LPB2021202275-12-8]|uniref:SagB family peptide dehydrogenase n=1 Tax=Nonomuraea sp. LPB2021202275-12-8 TaxID=3120159 RepID=UPI00300C8B72
MSAPDALPRGGETLRLRAGVSIGRERSGIHLVGYPDTTPIDGGDLAVVRALAAGEHRAEEFPAQARTLLSRLRQDGWLVVTVHDGDTPLYTLEPRTRPAAGAPTDVPATARLSRFTTIAAAPDGGLCATSPRAWASITVHAPGALATLADPGAAGPPSGISPHAASLLRRDLLWSGLAGTEDEDEEFRVRQWSALDLAFHRSSRGIDGEAGVAGGFGATYWGREHATVPGSRPPAAGPVTDLPRPDLERIRATDPSLTEALEARRSVRDHDAGTPITIEQLAEFLYRCAKTSGRPTPYGERPRRAYPGGGGVHELELYVVAHQVAGLESGTYHYDGYGHRLELVRRQAGAERILLDAARSMSGAKARPQVLLLVTARFEQLMWVYEGLAYALILKNLGVLMQTMYLVATAMGLGGCALGSSAPRVFQRIAGADPLSEDVVGEFMLGTVAAEHRMKGDA